MAHHLNDTCLNSKLIEKTNVALADAVFHDSAIAGLQKKSDQGFPEVKDTAAFLTIVCKWFNKVNVKDTLSGQKTRDESWQPVTLDTMTERLDFVKQFSEWLKVWEESGTRGLSKKTFLTARQTSSGLPELAKHLLESEKDLKYLLTGKLQSDALESHFGRYRQASGANYFASVRQFLEAEKIIRFRSLAKVLDLKEMQKTFEDIRDTTEQDLRELLISSFYIVTTWNCPWQKE